MEEKNLRELNMNELEKVSGGGVSDDMQALYDHLKAAGLLPTIAAMQQKKAIELIINYCKQNGLQQYIQYAVRVYFAI